MTSANYIYIYICIIFVHTDKNIDISDHDDDDDDDDGKMMKTCTKNEYDCVPFFTLKITFARMEKCHSRGIHAYSLVIFIYIYMKIRLFHG
jgi:hypothetical protein